MMNFVLIRGVLNRPAQIKTMANNDLLVSFDVTVERENEKAEVVPIVWFGVKAWATELDLGDEVVISGRIRKRFFQSGGALTTRTEVVAERVAKATQKRAVRVIYDHFEKDVDSALVA